MFSTGQIDNIPFNILKISVWTIYYFQTPCWTPSFSLKIIKLKKKTMATVGLYYFEAKIASLGHHAYKETSWSTG